MSLPWKDRDQFSPADGDVFFVACWWDFNRRVYPDLEWTFHYVVYRNEDEYDLEDVYGSPLTLRWKDVDYAILGTDCIPTQTSEGE